MSLKYTELGLPFTVAEVGMNHDGSMGSAINYIKALENTGVSAVKFQMHIADSESSNQEKFRVKVFPQDETRFEYWKRTSFTVEQWREIKKQADESGLIFFATPFSVKAVELLAEMQVKIWKVASGEVSNWYLLDAITEQEGTVLLSSGMSSYQEIDENVDEISFYNSSLKYIVQAVQHEVQYVVQYIVPVIGPLGAIAGGGRHVVVVVGVVGFDRCSGASSVVSSR